MVERMWKSVWKEIIGGNLTKQNIGFVLLHGLSFSGHTGARGLCFSIDPKLPSLNLFKILLLLPLITSCHLSVVKVLKTHVWRNAEYLSIAS